MQPLCSSLSLSVLGAWSAKALAIIAFASLLLGCAAGTQRMYPGPDLPSDQVVHLKRTGSSRVHAIDATEVDGWAWELQPGSHELVVSVKGVASHPSAFIVAWHSCAVQFVASPGITYKVDALSEVSKGEWVTVSKIDAIIVNVGTNQRVADCRAWCLEDC